MAMKYLKAMVDTFQTRAFQDGELTFFEVSKGDKVVATLAQASATSMYVWDGKATNRRGLLKTQQRTTVWQSAGVDFKVECERLLFRTVAAELAEHAVSIF